MGHNAVFSLEGVIVAVVRCTGRGVDGNMVHQDTEQMLEMDLCRVGLVQGEMDLPNVVRYGTDHDQIRFVRMVNDQTVT